MDQHDGHDRKPSTVRGNLGKLPAALQALCARPQWVIWRLTWRAGRWIKQPYRCDDPHRYASSKDPTGWSSYETAVAAAQAGDGISYVLTPDDPFAALDIDHVRDSVTGTIESWAQRLLDRAKHAYAEISPSGTGLRIWGSASGESLHRKFSLENGAALELFRRTYKPLTVTGLQLGNSRRLGNIDALVDGAVVWAVQQQHKQQTSRNSKTPFAPGQTSSYSIQEIARSRSPRIWSNIPWGSASATLPRAV
jgi:primase-polymerase (primpol)-like protein